MDMFFCQNCETPILDADKYIMYEGLCKTCYYKRVYQADMTPEQIDWIQPKEDRVVITIPGCEPFECSADDIAIIDSYDAYECKNPIYAQIKQRLDALKREKNKDFNER